MRIHTDVALSALTTLQVGGPATEMWEAETEDEIVEAIRDADDADIPLLLVAGGSNLLVSDEGFEGRVVRIASSGISVVRDAGDVTVDVAAGESWDGLVSTTVTEGLAGFECLSGIPGTTGATPIQNVGAYGSEVASYVVSVRAYDRVHGQVVTLNSDECRFEYRASAFKYKDRYVVLSVRFRLNESKLSAPIRYAELARSLGAGVEESAPIAEVRAAVLALRRSKGMVLDADDVDTRSAGSFFTNPIIDPGEFRELELRAEDVGRPPPAWSEPDGRVKVSAAWLIEQSGYSKGYTRGRARLSSKHALALTNPGQATAADVLALAREIRDAVQHRFGVRLQPEPVLVGIEL